MSNRLRRQTAAALLACVLIVGLLPGLAAAQDWSTLESRKAWFIEQHRGISIQPNGKFGPAIALARLAVNPDDAEVISHIAHFYDKWPATSAGQLAKRIRSGKGYAIKMLMHKERICLAKTT